MVVDEEDADVACGVGDVVGVHVRVVAGEVGAGMKADAEETVGGLEGGGLDVGEREVLLELGFVDGVVGAADFFGVVAPVPGFEGAVEAVGAGDGEEAVAFGFGFARGWGPDFMEQGFNGGG